MININRVLTLAKEKGITQKFICVKLDEGNTFLADVRRGKSQIPEEKADILAEILGTTPEYLRDETDDPGIKKEPRTWRELNLRPKVAELMNTLDGLSDEQLIKVLKMIDLLIDGETAKIKAEKEDE